MFNNKPARFILKSAGCISLYLALWFTGISAPAIAEPMSDLMGKFQSDNVPADFIVLVDTSKSMAGTRFTAVRSSLYALAEAVDPGDYFCVIGFDKKPHDLIPRHVISPGEKNSLLTAIRNCPEPHAVPKSGESGATDLCAGLSELIEQLSHVKANQIQFVFIFTDGHHQPPHRRSDESRLWNNLHKTAEEVLNSGGVEVEWLWFDGEASTEHIQRVFPDSVPMVVSSQALSSHFERLKDEIKMRRLRLQVRRELASGRVALVPQRVQVRLGYGNQTEVPVTLKSFFRHLNITTKLKENRHLSNDSSSFSMVPVRSNTELAPGQTGRIGTLIITHKAESILLYALSCFGIFKLSNKSHEIVVPVNLSIQPGGTLRRLDPLLETTYDAQLKCIIDTAIMPPIPVWLTYFILCLGLVTVVLIVMTRNKSITWPRIHLPKLHLPK